MRKIDELRLRNQVRISAFFYLMFVVIQLITVDQTSSIGGGRYSFQIEMLFFIIFISIFGIIWSFRKDWVRMKYYWPRLSQGIEVLRVLVGKKPNEIIWDFNPPVSSRLIAGSVSVLFIFFSIIVIGKNLP